MKKVTEKSEFISILNRELILFGVQDRNEIIADFEIHFSEKMGSGMSEAEICEKLGDITEIAKQYSEIPTPLTLELASTDDIQILEEEITTLQNESKQNETKTPPGEDEIKNLREEIKSLREEIRIPQKETPTFVKEDRKPNIISGLIIVLLMDMFIFSWLIPGAFALLVSILAIPVSLIGAGIASLAGAAWGDLFNFHSPFSAAGTIFLGISALSLGGLFTLIGIKLVALFIKIVKGIINWHVKTVTGKTIFSTGKGGNR